MELKAKTTSLIIKIIDVVFIVVCSFMKWKGILENITIGEICTVGAVIAAVFGDVSLNTALDKFASKEKINE